MSWNDAIAYAEWLSEKTGKLYRLPSEAEWEYSARSGKQTIYPWGDKLEPNRANCKDCSVEWSLPQTEFTGSYDANNFGLHDMLGNVKEWTLDCWNPSYWNAPTDGSARISARCQQRVVRGGAWQDTAKQLRPSYRSSTRAALASNAIGFRLVREM